MRWERCAYSLSHASFRRKPWGYASYPRPGLDLSIKLRTNSYRVEALTHDERHKTLAQWTIAMLERPFVSRVACDPCSGNNDVRESRTTIQNAGSALADADRVASPVKPRP